MFYDSILEIYSLDEGTNEIGEIIKSFTLGDRIKCDIQPSSDNLVKKTFGEDIESVYTVWADEDIDIGAIAIFNGKIFEINAKVDWDDYKIYSLKSCEVDIKNVN